MKNNTIFAEVRVHVGGMRGGSIRGDPLAFCLASRARACARAPSSRAVTRASFTRTRETVRIDCALYLDACQGAWSARTHDTPKPICQNNPSFEIREGYHACGAWRKRVIFFILLYQEIKHFVRKTESGAFSL
jgi:hypothetical protein